MFKDIFKDRSSYRFGWLSLALVLLTAASIVLGFAVRAGFQTSGFLSLNSDEVLAYHQLLFLVHSPQEEHYIPGWDFLRDFQRWAPEAAYYLAGKKLEAIPPAVCLINVLFYVLFGLMMFRRTRKAWALVPFFVLVVLPAPAIAYWGTQISELRSYYFYALILLWFSGSWFENGPFCFGFGFLALWGCWSNLLTVFFVIPVLWYEYCQGSLKVLAQERTKIFSLLGGISLALGLVALMDRSFYTSNGGYFHFGFHALGEMGHHLKLFVLAWPLYWLGGLPYGYLQDSVLGRQLDPAPQFEPLFIWVGLFWFLWLATLIGAVKSTVYKERQKELILWLAPAFLFAVFFIISAQSWDALTLRYLTYWQIFLPICLGLWASCLSKPWKNWKWLAVVVAWALLHGCLLANYYFKGPYTHPARHIEQVLEMKGYRAGYSNYWCPQFNNEVQHLGPAESGGYPKFYETILQASVVSRT